MYRTRTHSAVMGYGLYMYFSSRSSFRLAAKSLAPIKKRSHVSIGKWVQKYSDCVDRFRTDKRLVRGIFVDETLLQIDGQDYWMWIAYKPVINTCMLYNYLWPATFMKKPHLFMPFPNGYSHF
jgi:hypothetical protein